jgi:hypothetical protein
MLHNCVSVLVLLAFLAIECQCHPKMEITTPPNIWNALVQWLLKMEMITIFGTQIMCILSSYRNGEFYHEFN